MTLFSLGYAFSLLIVGALLFFSAVVRVGEEAFNGSYRTVPSLPSLLSTLAIEDAVAVAAVIGFVLLGENTTPPAPRPSLPLSYHTIPSLLSALAIIDVAATAVSTTTTVVLLRGHGRGVPHMMHASPCLLSFTMVQALHSHDGAILLIGGGD